MGVGSGIGRVVGKQMDDIFGDYFSKAARSVSESDVGRTDPKPAETYISQMRKSGVSEEEISDLGLEDLTGTPMTRDEMLAEIEARRSGSKLEIVSDAPQTDEVLENPNITITPTGEAAMAGYKDYVPEIGSPSTYEMLTYHKPNAPTTIEAQHGNVSNQLFHLRVNQGTTESGDKVTNLLEIQSDPGQAIAKSGEEVSGIPHINKGNWQLLGMKEAIKYAKSKGSRYLAIAPAEEIALSVGNRVRTDIDVPVRILRSEVDEVSGSPRYTFETPEGYELDPRPLLSDYSKFNARKNELLDQIDTDEWKTLLEDMGEYDKFRSMFSKDLSEEDFLKQSAWLAHKASMYDALVKINVDAANVFADAFKLPKDLRKLGANLNTAMEYARRQQPDKYTDLIFDDTTAFLDVAHSNVWGQEYIDLIDMVDWGEVAKIRAEKFHPKLTASEVGKYLGIDPKLVDDVAGSTEEFILPAGQHGGEGILQFYQKTLLGKKRLKKYQTPLVKTKVDRPDGTFVEVDALDLDKIPDDPKKTSYSLYALALANLGGVGKAVTEMNAAEQNNTEGKLQMADGGFVDEEGVKEAPVGALNEEVADNIDADLSEGEFVLPADVVRYIGLDRLMQLRQEAKEGLAKMEAMGQMGNGNEAVLADNTPHEPMQFAAGGAVPSATTPVSAMPTTVYQPSQFKQVAPIVHPAAGTPTTPTVTTPTAASSTTSTTPSTTGTATGGFNYEMKRYADSQGNAVYIPFVNGVAQIPIPTGYTETTRTGGVPQSATGQDTTTTQAAQAIEQPKDSDTGGDYTGPSGTPDATGTAPFGIGNIADAAEDKALSVLGNNPVADIMSVEAKNNPYVAQAMQDYNQANVLGWVGAGIGLLTGMPIASASLNKAAEYKAKALDVALANVNPAVKDILTQPTVKNTWADSQKVYTNALANHASQALAAEMAVTADNPFAGDYVGDLGSYESAVANSLGTNVGSAQTAMLTNQELGMFGSPQDRANFYANDPFAGGITAGPKSGIVSNANWADPDTGLTGAQTISNANWADPDTGLSGLGSDYSSGSFGSAADGESAEDFGDAGYGAFGGFDTSNPGTGWGGFE